MKLDIELVPQPLWYKNLRAILPKSVWDKIRQVVYFRSGYMCQACSTPKQELADPRLFCHEEWKYDDKKHVQTLVGFRCTCSMCSNINHRGMANVLGIDENTIAEHFMRVNSCDRKTYDKHVKESFDLWQRRGRYKWTQDLSRLEELLKELGSVPKLE